MPRVPAAERHTLGPLISQFTIAAICVIDWADSSVDGDFLYLFRLAGIADRVKAMQTVAGERFRLQGHFLAAADTRRWASRSAIVPQAIADDVTAAFAEHPRLSTRDRVTVHLDFDLWAIRETRAALGYRVHCEGRAWVPVPLSSLIAAALARPVPTAPSLEST